MSGVYFIGVSGRGLLDVAAGDAHPALAVHAVEMPEGRTAGIAFESHGHAAILA